MGVQQMKYYSCKFSTQQVILRVEHGNAEKVLPLPLLLVSFTPISRKSSYELSVFPTTISYRSVPCTQRRKTDVFERREKITLYATVMSCCFVTVPNIYSRAFI